MSAEKLELLREALPYIRRFKGKSFVVKLSGHAIDDAEGLHSLAEEVALLDQVGFRIVLVHGGGKQLNELTARLGISQRFVDGRRVTSDETLEVAKMVFSGKVNTDIRSMLRRLGVRPIGLSGLDGNLIRARRREIQQLICKETGEEESVDFGHVGDIVEVDGHLLELLLDEGYVPVISSLGADDDGNVYNINADSIATEVAVHLKAEKLIMLTNVDGVYGDIARPETKISHLTAPELDRLLEENRVSEGMIPKLTAIRSLLDRGVPSAHIIHGGRRNALLQEIFTDCGTGTMITG